MLMVVTKHRICHWESEVASSLDSGGLCDCGEGGTRRKSPLDSWGSRFREALAFRFQGNCPHPHPHLHNE